MEVNRYFRDELAYLRDLGSQFAELNPLLAPFLAEGAHDPDVERLLEGFAFLTARLRQKIDDDLPELTHSLVGLLWPHVLRPIPAMCVLRFTPIAGAITQRRDIARGAVVCSRPQEGTRCPFQTCYDVALLGLTIQSVRAETIGSEGKLHIGLRLSPGWRFADLACHQLRLHLSGTRDPSSAREMLHWLARGVRQIALRPERGDAIALTSAYFAPVGFEPDEEVIPAPRNVFASYRILQEYFAFPEKFLFIDLLGLDALTDLEGQEVEIIIRGKSLPHGAEALRASDLFLNCTPAINLFPHSAEPILLDQMKTEYRVRPTGSSPSHYGIYAINRVHGLVPGAAGIVEYPPFESFSYIGQPEQIYYYTRLSPAITGTGTDLSLSFIDRSRHISMPPTRTISVGLTCTNGALADLIPLGAVDQPTGGSPGFATFRNIASVTKQAPAPLGGDLLWRLIGNLAISAGALVSVDTLRTMIETYDFRAQSDEQAKARLAVMLRAIESVETHPLNWLDRGRALYGQSYRVTLDETRFGGSGEAFLFGSVLDRFLELFSALNTCHQLRVVGKGSNTVIDWPIRMGSKSLQP